MTGGLSASLNPLLVVRGSRGKHERWVFRKCTFLLTQDCVLELFFVPPSLPRWAFGAQKASLPRERKRERDFKRYVRTFPQKKGDCLHSSKTHCVSLALSLTRNILANVRVSFFCIDSGTFSHL